MVILVKIQTAQMEHRMKPRRLPGGAKMLMGSVEAGMKHK
jgi:hypothetical protein